jgi:hypothetical protein
VYAVVRVYSGQDASEVFDVIGQREADVKALIGGVPGFASWARRRR